jgi:hypothetical protein
MKFPDNSDASKQSKRAVEKAARLLSKRGLSAAAPSAVAGGGLEDSAPAESEDVPAKRLTRKEKKELERRGLGSAPMAVARKYRVDAKNRLAVALEKGGAETKRLSLICPAAAALHHLSRMAYNASRSGTKEQLDATVNLALTEMEKLLPGAQEEQEQGEDRVAFSISAARAVDVFTCVANALFFFALSGVADRRGLLRHMLPHAADALSKVLAARDILNHNRSVAQKVLNGLCELAAAGISTSELREVGICDHVRGLFSALNWPDSLNDSKQETESTPGDISLQVTAEVLKTLYEELFSNASTSGGGGGSPDAASSFWMHSATGGPLTALWSHSVKQKKVRTAVAAAKDTKDASSAKPSSGAEQQPESGAGAGAGAGPGPVGIKLARLSVTGVGEVVWQGDSPIGFADMNAPLVVDVGCGFGVTLLGLAASRYVYRNSDDTSFYSRNLPEGDINFLGCDLSNHCVSYASNIAREWKIDSRCRFCVAPAESFLNWVLTKYPGPVIFVCIQFPTPYKLDHSILAMSKGSSGSAYVISSSTKSGKKNKSLVDGHRRNVQLPGINEDNGFMITPKLVRLAVEISRRNNACIFVQSNVEDVAVFCRALFHQYVYNPEGDAAEFEILKSLEDVDCGFSVGTEKRQKKSKKGSNRQLEDTNNAESGEPSLPNRKLIWATMGGESAAGQGWLAASPLPICGRTETEAVYATSGKPVYRFAWTTATA